MQFNTNRPPRPKIFTVSRGRRWVPEKNSACIKEKHNGPRTPWNDLMVGLAADALPFCRKFCYDHFSRKLGCHRATSLGLKPLKRSSQNFLFTSPRLPHDFISALFYLILQPFKNMKGLLTPFSPLPWLFGRGSGGWGIYCKRK